MPDCLQCGRNVERLLDGLCGICDVTAHRRGPGFVGRQYPNEVNPDTYEPAKEMSIGIKSLIDHPDPRQRISEETAARFMKTLVAPAEQVEQARKQAGPMYAEYQRANDEMIRRQEDDIRSEEKRAKEKLVSVIREKTVTGLTTP